MFFKRFVDQCWTLVLPMLVLLVAVPPTFFIYGSTPAWLLSYGGTFVIMFGNIVYIVFFDSRRRWPNVSWRRRAFLFFTCSSD